MDSNKVLGEQMREINLNNPKNQFENIKSKYVLQIIFDYLNEKKSFSIIKYTKRIQQRINKNSNDFKNLLEIEIEIKLGKNKYEYNRFININEKDRKYYHIYFDDNKEEIKNKYEIVPRDEVTKIKIIIDYQIKSFKDLFFKCECIISINFKKFYRNNINNMSYMFSWCSSLKQINFSNFNTNNVKDMICMFWGCSSLKELNLFNFNTRKVTLEK